MGDKPETMNIVYDINKNNPYVYIITAHWNQLYVKVLKV